MKITKKPQLAKSAIVKAIPLACSNETAAVEFLEKQRWGECPNCVYCGSVNVYKMTDAKTGERNKRFLWRCREKKCGMQYTVRIGTVYEESRLPLRHWCYAFWASCASKKGVSALQISRQCQISYKSALFLMHRIRFAMTPDRTKAPQLNGIVECDETYVGGKPRNKHPLNKRGMGTSKTPVFAMLERGGNVRVQAMANVTSANLHAVMQENIDIRAAIHTDELNVYPSIATRYGGGHHTVKHKDGEYARGDVTTNSVEGFFSILKRGLNGTYHAVSKEHLHRYLAEFEFRYNARKLNDGERTMKAIQQAEGKRLMYKSPNKAS